MVQARRLGDLSAGAGGDDDAQQVFGAPPPGFPPADAAPGPVTDASGEVLPRRLPSVPEEPPVAAGMMLVPMSDPGLQDSNIPVVPGAGALVPVSTPGLCVLQTSEGDGATSPLRKRRRWRQIGDWTEYKDKQGRAYYVNSATKETQWEAPLDFGGSEWTEEKDDDGKSYYVNVLTKETVWTRPPELREDAKPDFIREAEARERKRARVEQRSAIEARIPTVGRTHTFELPLTEADVRAANRKERERRLARGERKSGLTRDERDREDKRAARRATRLAREAASLEKLKQQASARRAKEKEKEAVPIDVDNDEVPERDAIHIEDGA